MKRSGQMSEEEFTELADRAVLEVLRLQEEVGVDVVTDGEQRRDNFYSFVADKLEGVQLMTLAEMLDVVEDKAGFERILQTLDVPAYSISNPTCVGKVSRRTPLAVDELRFARHHTDRPVKVTLPGPYLLTRAMYVPALARDAYPSKEDLGEDVVAVLREEVRDLVEEGADFIQLDEPVLTEVVFTQGQTRTFMCASLAVRKDPAEELEFAASLINRVVEGFEGVRLGLHVCRGNWSQNEATLLRGSYHPLAPYLERLDVGQLVLEYATERGRRPDRLWGQGAWTRGGEPPLLDDRVARADRPVHRAGAATLPRRQALAEPGLWLRDLLQPPRQHPGDGRSQAHRHRAGHGPLPRLKGFALKSYVRPWFDGACPEPVEGLPDESGSSTPRTIGSNSPFVLWDRPSHLSS